MVAACLDIYSIVAKGVVEGLEGEEKIVVSEKILDFYWCNGIWIIKF